MPPSCGLQSLTNALTDTLPVALTGPPALGVTGLVSWTHVLAVRHVERHWGQGLVDFLLIVMENRGFREYSAS